MTLRRRRELPVLSGAPPPPAAPEVGQPERVVAALAAQGAAAPPAELARFAREVDQSLGRRRWRRDRLAAPGRLDAMDIARWAALARDAGDRDEVLWRGFLGAHLGYLSADPRRPQQVSSAGRLLCGFGAEPLWTWGRASSELGGLRAWLGDHRAELATLRFGNHRKYESAKPDALFAVVESFLRWVGRRGGTPEAAFTPAARDPAGTFEELARSLGAVHRFGRTACFETDLDHAVIFF